MVTRIFTAAPLTGGFPGSRYRHAVLQRAHSPALTPYSEAPPLPP